MSITGGAAIAPTPTDRPSRETWGRCLKYLEGMYAGFFISAWASILVGILNLGNAKILKHLFDDVLLAQNMKALPEVVTLLVLVYSCKGIASFIARHTTFLLGSFFAYQTRKALFAKMMRLPMTYFETEKTGQILNRFTWDVQVVQNNTNVFYHAVKDISTILAGIGLLLWIHPKLAVRTFLVLPLVGFLATRIAKKLRHIGKLSANKTGDVTSFLSEAVLGIQEVQSFSAEDRMGERFEEINAANKKLADQSAKYQALATPAVEIIVSFGLGWVIWAGSSEVIGGNLTPGQFIEFLTSLGLLFEPMRKLSDLNNHFAATKAHADRFLEILDHPIDAVDPKDPKELVDPEGRVQFHQVGFSYDPASAEPTLEAIDLEVQPGEVVALVGASGAGKTTLVKLLPRFYGMTQGSITIDGVPIDQLKVADLRGLFGIVPQETILFSGTVADNIAFGVEEACPDRIREAAKAANALGFIEELEGGFDTEIGERGVRLSGGQKQRIAIARALMKDPRILILDEATSALDTESERLVQEALDRLMKSRTTFVIAHRLSTIQGADQIVVLSRGQIVERGSHRELISQSGEYARLCRQQMVSTPRAEESVKGAA